MGTASDIKLRKLTKRDDEPIEEIVKRGVEEFRGESGEAIVELRLIDKSGTKARTSFSVQITPAGPSVLKKSARKPDFVAIMTDEAFRRMAGGSYSPFQAYQDGNLKVHGNLQLGRQIIRRLVPVPEGGGGGGMMVLIVDEGYDPAGESLTLSGCGFTPNGGVKLYYDYGGGQYESIISADSDGAFNNFTQPGIACGPMTNGSNVGVVVTATDLTTGAYTTQGYATPC